MTNILKNNLNLDEEQILQIKKQIKTILMIISIVSIVFVMIWCAGGIYASNNALSHANLSRNDVDFIRFEFDLDDFIPAYEVSWHQNYREAEYTVHAITGQLISWDLD